MAFSLLPSPYTGLDLQQLVPSSSAEDSVICWSLHTSIHLFGGISFYRTSSFLPPGIPGDCTILGHNGQLKFSQHRCHILPDSWGGSSVQDIETMRNLWKNMVKNERRSLYSAIVIRVTGKNLLKGKQHTPINSNKQTRCP